MSRSIFILRGSAILLRGVSHLIRSWPLLALVLFFLSETVPHLRVVGSYYGYHYEPRCIYLGTRGIIEPKPAPVGCPLLVLLNAKTGALP